MLGRTRWLAVAIAAAFSVALAGPAAASQGQAVELKDDCDPATFNAAIGPGTCVGDGQTTFSQFIAELVATKVAEDWKFDPTQVSLKGGDTLTARNEGGETHSFTKVVDFGGGFVPILNLLSGNPVVAQPADPTQLLFLPAGSSLTVPSNLLSVGQNKFQCFIHPWMRTVVTVLAGN